MQGHFELRFCKYELELRLRGAWQSTHGKNLLLQFAKIFMGQDLEK